MVELNVLINSDVLYAFAFHAALVVGKTMMMTVFTAIQRYKTGVFRNPEDIVVADGKVQHDNERVEKVRRCHLNDMENVYPFVLLGLLYILVAKPSLSVATWHFRAFTVGRVFHTLAYLSETHKRGFGFLAGYIVCWSMFVQIILATFKG